MDLPNILFPLLLCLFCAYAQNQIRFRVMEEQPAGTFVGSLADTYLVQDVLLDDARSLLLYTFLSSGFSHACLFTINATTGVIYTAKPLDREALCGLDSPTTCELSFEVLVHSDLVQFFRMATVIVEVEDVNDHAPEFPQPKVRLEVPELVPLNTALLLAAAEDPDIGPNGVQGYSLAGPPGGPFAIQVFETRDGGQDVTLLVKSFLDRELTPSYRLTVVAEDGGRPPRTGTVQVEIAVLDINDNPPVFHPSNFTVSVEGTTPPGTVIATFNVTDADLQANGQREFSFSPSMQPEVMKYFRLDSSTGQLVVASTLTQIQGQTVTVGVQCSDGGQPPLVDEAEVQVSVADSPNTPPEAILIALSGGDVTVRENAPPGTFLALLQVRDPDHGPRGLVSCSTRSDVIQLQKLDMHEYKVILARILDREMQDTHNVSINCRDAGSPPLDTTMSFILHVLDVNDNSPRFEQGVYYANVKENNMIGLMVARVVANDPDRGENGYVEYSISSSSDDAGVTIDRNTGYIATTRSFDYERTHQVTFGVMARDRGMPRQTSMANVRLTITDVNDNRPTFEQNVYQVRVAENTTVGTTVGNVSADDMDSGENGHITYSLAWQNTSESAQLPLAVSPSGILTLVQELDHETRSEYSLRVLATDGGTPPQRGSARITLLVDHINDNPV